MKIIDDDYTFTTNDWGIERKYGTGEECNNPTGRNKGQIRMNLRGTDFHFDSTVSNNGNGN